ncbi:MAG TPA: DoxX family protein [Acetobacteraceae bacterium]|jgi:putative oxidoreductase|nr:DoxX family protein [Acetobacteraceae bacterium]
MNDFRAGRIGDCVILAARVLLVVLFLVFGWRKLTGFEGTVASFTQGGIPMPPVAAVVAVVMEFFGGLALLLGVATRPIALALAVYTLATAFLGHPYWAMTGAAQAGAMINFYKNVSIMGGLLLLYVTGAGKYAVDAWWSAHPR